MADIKKIKLGDTTYNLRDADAARSTDVVYSNSTPIVEGIGSIKPGTTFENISIKTMLDKILYPYIDIEVSFNSMSSPAGSYYVQALPTLASVSFNVKKNSATDIIFELWDKTGNSKLDTKTGDAVVDGKLIFSDLNIIVDTTRTFELRYCYTGEEDTVSKICSAGTFTIAFQNPTAPTLSHTVSDNSAGGTATTYYCGETCTLGTIVATIGNLNSASATGGITKLELYNGTTPIQTVEATEGAPLSLPYTFNLNTSLSSSTATTFTYKVKAYYMTRTGTDTTLTSTSTDSNTLTITFQYVNPSITSFTGIPSGTFSRLAAKSISNPACKFKKNSGKITQVKLLEGTTELTANDVEGLATDVYTATETSSTFMYSASNICSNKVFYAKAYNGAAEVASKSVEMKFYSPYCWGFVDANTTFDTITLDTIKSLEKQEQTFSNKKIVITGPAEQKKFLFVAPATNYTKVADPAGNDAMTSFEKGGQKKTITFADGKTTQEYQVFLAAKAAADAAINYTFS